MTLTGSRVRHMGFCALLTVAVVAASPPAAARAGGGPCVRGCKLQARECVINDARSTKRACKLDCRTSAARASRAACKLTCTDAFRADKRICKSQRSGCLGVCEAPADDPSLDRDCLEACGAALGSCVRPVVEAGRECLAGCNDLPSGERLTCLLDCIAAGQSDALTCATGFLECIGDCGLTTPTSTIPILPGCGDAPAPECFGLCPLDRPICTHTDAGCACTELPVVECGDARAPLCFGRCPVDRPLCIPTDGTCECRSF